MAYVIGLMSGTSVDGIDAALVEITGTDWDLKVELLAGVTYPYPVELKKQILALCGGAAISMAELAELDDAIALAFAHAAQSIQMGHPPAQLIGSHGQTVYHRPPVGRGEGEKAKGEGEKAKGEGEKAKGERRKEEQNRQRDSPLPELRTPNSELRNASCLKSGDPPTALAPPNSELRTPLGYTLQLGRGAVIAHATGISTVSNFRVADITAGGQGAPLVSKVDACLLGQPQASCCVQNIGGIGNVTYLPARQGNWLAGIRGWDTGPGNTLLDLAVHHLTDGAESYDRDGVWAASGTPCRELVEQWLSQDYFQQLPPKSTGREHFGLDYLHQCLAETEIYSLSSADLLATLTELTVASIVHSYRTFLPHLPQQVLLCGGGSRNLYLKSRLQSQIPSVSVLTTGEVGLSVDFKEAIAFAVLAYWRQIGIPGNLRQVTGAKLEVLLGDVHQPIEQRG